MIPAHGGHTHAAGSGTDWGVVVPVVALLVVAAGYVALALLRRRDHRGWSGWRTVSFVTGIALLVAGLVPALIPLPDGTFVAHMYQHLLIGMYAPLALVLGAPATLLLRSVPHRYGRVIGRLLGSGPMGVLAHPVTALVLNVGGLYLLYTTPLYQATVENPALHHVVHLHFFLAGYLFAYSIAGPDPAPHRPSVPTRLVVLGVAILGHAVLAQLLYAGVLVYVQAPAHDLKAGADLMYYAGDIAELLLALAMVSTWRPEPGRSTGRATSRSTRRPGRWGSVGTTAGAPMRSRAQRCQCPTRRVGTNRREAAVRRPPWPTRSVPTSRPRPRTPTRTRPPTRRAPPAPSCRTRTSSTPTRTSPRPRDRRAPSGPPRRRPAPTPTPTRRTTPGAAMSEQQDPYNPEDTETEPDDQGPGTGETVKEEGGFVSPHQTESAQEDVEPEGQQPDGSNDETKG